MKAKTELKATLWAILPPLALGLFMFGLSLYFGITERHGAAAACFFIGIVFGFVGPFASYLLLVDDMGSKTEVLVRFIEEREEDSEIQEAKSSPELRPGQWREKQRWE